MEQVEAQPVEPTDVDSEVTAEQARIAELEEQLETAIQKAAEERERALRTAAEMENLRRRTELDVEKAHKFALEKFAAELLPVLDNLERAIELADKENEALKPMVEGVELTLKSMQSMQKGYDLNGRVIRPAMVMIAKAVD